MQTSIETAFDAMFSAAALPSLWPSALDQLAAALGAAGAIIFPKDPRLAILGSPISHSLAEVFDTYVKEGWHERDIRGQRGWPALARDGKAVLLDSDILDAETRRQHADYFNFYDRFDLPGFLTIGFFVERQPWTLTLLRSRRQPEFQHSDITRFGHVQQTLQRVVSLAITLRRASEGTILNLADTLGHKAVLVDHAGNVTGATEALRAAGEPDLRVVNGRLLCRSADNNTRLQAMLTSALQASSPAQQGEPYSARIDRPNRRPLLLQAIALPWLVRDVFSRAAVLLLVHDLDAGASPPPADILKLAFGLTKAEVRLASLMAEGMSATEAADVSAISHETARSHLKTIFAKTGVNRQSELAVLLSRLPGRK